MRDGSPAGSPLSVGLTPVRRSLPQPGRRGRGGNSHGGRGAPARREGPEWSASAEVVQLGARWPDVGRLAAVCVAGAVALASAAPARAAFPALTPAAVAALGGHPTQWQMQWLESGGASGVPLAGGAVAAAPDVANAAYLIGGQIITLSGGSAQTPAQGAAPAVTTQVLGPEATGDINGDGQADAAALLTQQSGGRTLYDVALLVGGNPGAAAATAPLGGAATSVALTGGQVVVQGTGGPARFVLSGGALEAAGAATAGGFWQPIGFQATDTEAGYCFVGSIAAARPGAYRCFTGNAIHDPCFTVLFTPQVDCPQGDPAAERGTTIQLTQPLPAGNQTPAGTPRPWQFSLQGGGTCGAATGTLVSPDHPYDCLIPAAATAPQQAVYCTAPAQVAEAYAAQCGALSAQPAANGAPQLAADRAYAVIAMWL